MCRGLVIAALVAPLMACSSNTDSAGGVNVPGDTTGNPFATRPQDTGTTTSDVTRSGDTGPATPDTTVDAESPPCEEGKACNDGDFCTKSDVCTGGACMGVPIDCTASEAPCASATCVDGICERSIDDGFCLIDDACWTEGQPNENEPCQRCVPVLSTDAWSNNDGDTCGEGEDDLCNPFTCQGGACVANPVVCDADDGNPCTADSCLGGDCEQLQVSGDCDDGDPCTTGDVCDKGNCIGGTADCDDGLTCTTDSCAGADCVHAIAPGFCAIDGMCVAAGEKNPMNTCQVCEPTVDPAAWGSAPDGDLCEDGSDCSTPDSCQAGVCLAGPSPCPDDGDPCTVPTCEGNACDMEDAVAGTLCDDGDVCTLNDSCSAGVCVPGPTDEACLPDPGCTYHADCYPEQICGSWYTTGEQKCSDPCAGDQDCPFGFICSKAPGSIQVGYCEPAIGAGAQDTPCSDGTTCETGLCVNSKCAGGCLDDQHCTAPNHTCELIGDLSIGYAGTACTDDGALKQQGQMCTNDGNTWDSLQCASGHCDLSAPTDALAVCSNACTSQNDCQTGQICGIVFHAAPPLGITTNSDAIPYHPLYTVQTYDGIAGCHSPLFGTGFKADSLVCQENNDCQSGHCLPLVPEDDTRYCTRMCSLDSDCQGTMQCKMEVVNLTSGWLEVQATNNINAFSLVRICKFP